MLTPRKIAEKPTMTALPLNHCLAKTFGTSEGKLMPGRTVFEHACITGEIAQTLIGMYPKTIRESFFPSGSAYLASAHDVGKVSPTFQNKIHAATGHLPSELAIGFDPNLEIEWGGHAGTGYATLKACNPGAYLAETVGRHHGQLKKPGEKSEGYSLGGNAWHGRRIEFLEALKGHFKETWPRIDSRTQADVLAGLTTLADWIASGSVFDDPRAPWQDKIALAVNNAGFVKVGIRPDLSFEDVFGCSPYTVQEHFVSTCTTPGVYVLEAPMGIGKTEAALYAAYRLLEKGLAAGLYFALPTRLTSNKMHRRVSAFLQKIISPGTSHRAFLLHGNAHLQEVELGEEGAPGREWFNSLKRAILAPFGVGTLDQALLAVLDVPHNFLRSFGLLGKVVILDEVHSYDGYTGVILDSLVESLRELHCTVIILSATLTQERKAALFVGGTERDEYPLISARALDETHLRELPVPTLPDREVGLHICGLDQNAFNEALERSSQGQQVLWMENTVAEAQDAYKKLAALSPSFGNIELGLLHSRFLPHDRAQLEERWTGYYGKDARDRGEHGRILVGTQVLEQSLDIDADFLITRLCPTDMFLQRLGRLWRHEHPDRAPSAKCDAWLLAPPQAESMMLEQFGNSAKVYDPYILFRSLEVLRPLIAVNLPNQIHQLMEATYAEREERGQLARLKATLKKNAERLAAHARVGMSDLGRARKESIVTRYCGRAI